MEFRVWSFRAWGSGVRLRNLSLEFHLGFRVRVSGLWGEGLGWSFILYNKLRYVGDWRL